MPNERKTCDDTATNETAKNRLAMVGDMAVYYIPI